MAEIPIIPRMARSGKQLWLHNEPRFLFPFAARESSRPQGGQRLAAGYGFRYPRGYGFPGCRARRGMLDRSFLPTAAPRPGSAHARIGQGVLARDCRRLEEEEFPTLAR